MNFTSMKPEIIEVKSRRERKAFILLPEKIHRNHAQWVHPIYMDEFTFFNPAKNPAFQSCDTIMLLARKNGQFTGRIMGIINHAYNRTHEEANARFCFLDTAEDPDCSAALMHAIEAWAIKKGMHKLVGPLAFSDKEPQGMLIEGFDEKVVIATNYNFQWLPERLSQLGFEKEKDLVSYIMPVPEKNLRLLEVVCNRLKSHSRWEVMHFSTKKQLKPWVVPIFRLINTAYRHIYGFKPLTETEMHDYAKRYMPVLDPHFVKIIASENNEVIAFVVAIPEISDGIRKAKGRLFPFGWWHIIRASSQSTLLTMLLGAVDEKYRGIGLDALLAAAIFQAARERNMQKIDSHLILENNEPMRAEYERYQGRLHKRYRIYRKELAE